ncbi:DUF4241 domain-containing protein [Streptomyces sedi]|nr:DUF4241 domain-containing protein [Streptomyces sedi]
MTLPAPDVARLFTVGGSHRGADGLIATVVSLHEAPLTLPTGRVAACDPMIGIEEGVEPFTDEVPPGTYPVVLSVAEVARPDDASYTHERAAAAWLRIGERPAADWSAALTAGQDPAELAHGEWFGYGVDTGTACFVDASVTPRLRPLLGEDGDGGPLIDAVYGTASPSLTPRPAAVVEPESGVGMVAFPSGWGDGAYPTWVGRDAAGRVVGFLTTFFVVEGAG